MNTMDMVPCTILSRPVINTEQPFTMLFGVSIHGDTMEAMFMGEFARQLKNNIRPGDKGVIREATVQGDKIAFTFIHLDPKTANGRNVDFFA